ncbi:unnamed protein product [Protopolystoma xenopodis]|uniref:C2H2-type domain-containing protein n=1 Tax=Protopolystoma xenopodis TaxID=117903 RepID=A0A3S5B054_9PLAT|nr:unnamed protein product [Protopolystoma xenopodis]
MEICDGVSFYSRTPLPRSTSCASKSHSKRIEELAGESGNTTPNKLTDGDAGSAGRAADEDEEDEACGTVPPMGALVCGICGVQVASRDRMHRHFTVYHLQCVLCANQLPSMDELSYHYRRHLDEIDLTQTTESGDKEAGDILKANLVATIPASIIGSDGQAFMKPENEEAATALPAEVDQGRQRTNATLLALARKLMTCDICSNFTGTKHNYFFHQWVEHGVVHPPFSSGTDQILISAGSLARQARLHSTPSLLHADSVAVGCDVGLVLGISNKRFKCKFCGFVVRVSGREYLEHLMEKHNIQASGHTICRVCADLFETPEALSDHLRDEHVALGEYDNAGLQTIFRCQLCDFWAFMKGMLRHSRDVHNDPAPAIFECAHCHQRFSDRREWRTHLDKHTEGYTHACPECGRSFRLRQSLVHHINTHHGDDEMPIDCEFCGITFPKRSSLRFHIQRTHSREMAHECSMCQRRFRLETDLRRHMKETHSGAVKCEICNKICNNLRCYSQHRQKHFRTRIYQCTDCQATFKSKLAMKRHIRVQHLQLGPERFECQICGKIVTQIAMHMLIHKDARFECEYCGKRFTKSAYYNEHVRIHRGERPFECHICGKRFNKKSNLNVHVRFHEKHRDEEGNVSKTTCYFLIYFGGIYHNPQSTFILTQAKLIL